MAILDDVHYGVRLLRKAPGFTAVAVGTIAVAIAANTAIFSVVYATLLAPLPYPNPEQLVMVWSDTGGDRNVVSPADFEDWQARSAVFQSLHAWSGHAAALSLGDRPEPVWAGESTPGMQTMVGNRFLLGRDFLPEEAQPGRDRVLILSNRVWRERFASDPAIVGRTVRLDRAPHVVVGVLAPGEADRGEAWMTVPLALAPERRGRGARFLLVMGRLKPGVSLEQANANMRAVADALALEHPETNRGSSAVVQPLHNNFLPRDTVRGLWLLMGAVGFVLLIACVNLANLLLARGTGRRREVAVRAALGASRARVFRQLLTESVVLAGAGALVGLALARVLLDGILALMPAGTLPLEADVQMNLPVLLATVAASLLAGIAAGCVPAWQATRPELDTVLRQEARSAVGGGGGRLRRALVAAEFALALTLLAGASVAAGSLVELVRSDVAMRTDHVLTFTLGLPPERAASRAGREAFLREALLRLQALPGVRSAAVSTGSPGNMRFAGGFRLVGDSGSGQQGAAFNMVSPDYFATYGLQVERGRAFDARDAEGAPPVAMVSDRFVAQYLQGRDPLAQRIAMSPLGDFGRQTGTPREWQIVGVFRGARLRGPDSAMEEIAVPFWQASTGEVTVAVHTGADPEALAGAAAAVVRSLDPDLPLVDVRTVRQRLDGLRAGHRFQAVLFAAFAGIALLLAALGIYGVMSFVVAQRRQEIAIRLALGAERAQVLRLVMREGLTTAAAGTAAGLGGAYAIARLMQGMWDGAARVDPAAFALVLGVLLASAALACFVPARRAASVDPLAALRDQ
jgi:putative ABC transport system permease protein